MLALAIRNLPPARAEWGHAMCAELACVEGSRERRRFSLGCARAAAVLRVRASLAPCGCGGAGVRAVVLAGTVAVLGLAVYGLVRYPSLHAGPAAWGAIAVFAVVLLAYGALAIALSRGRAPGVVAARRHGLAGGAVVGAAWLWILAPGAISKELVFVPLAAALLVPAGVALRTARSGAGGAAATGAALWSGLTGSLLAFIVWVSATYASDGRPYDAQMLRDFHASGAHDLAAYAVGDALGAAFGLLVIVPLVALAIGSLCARVAARPQPG